MKIARFPVMAALGLAFGLASIPMASAQTSGAQPPAAQQQSPSFSENDLKSFASAAMKVEEIHKAYQPRVQSAQTTDERLEIREQASNEMQKAVRDEGLSVDKYNQIYAAAQNDPAVAQEIDKYLRQPQ